MDNETKLTNKTVKHSTLSSKVNEIESVRMTGFRALLRMTVQHDSKETYETFHSTVLNTLMTLIKVMDGTAQCIEQQLMNSTKLFTVSKGIETIKEKRPKHNNTLHRENETTSKREFTTPQIHELSAGRVRVQF